MINLIHVSKKYKTGVRALNDVTLSIDEGAFVYVIGSTGAGKSTFIKLLYREEKPSSGKVIVNGQDVGKIKNRKACYFRRNIGIVFQDYRLLNKKTVFENIAFAMEVTDARKKDIRDRVKEVLSLVGLEDKVKSFPHQLSGGQQQRVVIARAIVNRPKVLICDEPTGNLDPDTAREIMDVLERINKEEKTTIVMVTHDKNIVDQYIHRTIRIEGGFVTLDTEEGGYEDVSRVI